MDITKVVYDQLDPEIYEIVYLVDTNFGTNRRLVDTIEEARQQVERKCGNHGCFIQVYQVIRLKRVNE